MESLLALIAKALSGPAMVNAVLFFAAAAAGQVLHGVVKWTQSEVASPLAWFTTNGKATVAAVIVNIGAAVTAIQLLPIDTMTAWASIYAGVLCGLGSDTVNKGARAEWTPEQRAAAAPAAKP
jgi:hypothetical protein